MASLGEQVAPSAAMDHVEEVRICVEWLIHVMVTVLIVRLQYAIVNVMVGLFSHQLVNGDGW